MNHLGKMPFKFAFDMLKKAIEEDNEKHLWDFYLKMVERMDKKDFKSFNEWKKQQIEPNKKVEKIKPMDENYKSALLMKVNKIKSLDQKKRG